MPSKHSPTNCPVCTNLKDIETSFAKYDWKDKERPLPKETLTLEPIRELTTYDEEKNHIKICPLCETCYYYQWSHEYLVNGDEEEETLTRLSPEESKKFAKIFHDQKN